MAMNWALPYPARRQPILADNAVATSQPLATQAGVAMLAGGGNAVDAALATAIALTVVEPCSNGIGSDLFAIIWDGRELTGLNASGRAPAAWSRERFASPGEHDAVIVLEEAVGPVRCDLPPTIHHLATGGAIGLW